MAQSFLDLSLATVLLGIGLILAYYGRKCVYQFRHFFGFLFGLAIFVFLLKADYEIFQFNGSWIILLCIAALFGTLGVVAVHFLSIFLTLALGFLLGSSLYSILISFPYIYPVLVDWTLARQSLFAVLQVASLIFVYYYDYLAIIISTAVTGAFMSILGTDMVIKGGISNIFFHGIQHYRRTKPSFSLCIELGIFVCIAVMGVFHQLTLY